MLAAVRGLRAGLRPQLRPQLRRARGIATTAELATKTQPRLTQRTRLGAADTGSADSADSFDGDHQLTLEWPGATPKTVLIVKKDNDKRADSALVSICRWMRRQYPQINVVLEPAVFAQMRGTLDFVRTVAATQSGRAEYARVVDFVVTLGGDGTFLHVASLFDEEVPPVVPFSMGTLGFLLPFDVADFPARLQSIIEGASTVLPRTRLAYSRRSADGSSSSSSADTRLRHITNEASIHRGTYPHLTTIECFLNGHLLTTSVGDGIIVATPTGSTAYALSAGGPIVHPLVSSMLVAPVCPRSLSFRPLMLPPDAVVRLQVHRLSRGRAAAFVDGRDCGELRQGECIEIRRSPFPLLCVNRENLAAGWAHDINQLLQFNRSFAHPHEAPFGEADPDFNTTGSGSAGS
ncbi:NADH kinase pos5 [Coemansia sp. RSA 1285]|nr:NADH kinase pos5 [Coemansia sp. RSA 1285]